VKLGRNPALGSTKSHDLKKEKKESRNYINVFASNDISIHITSMEKKSSARETRSFQFY
jgi:hypothetical protein